ncbi:MAG TPA: sugar-binding protein, partial [Armatimonadota bacterium]|nr:sugar-binding protein [Armatimonadota bacterium]
VRPQDPVVGCTTAGVDYPFIENVLKNGGAGAMDALSIHPYYYPRSPEKANLLGDLARMKALLERYGVKQPKIWLSEFGYPSQLDEHGVTPARSAAYMVRYYLQALSQPYVERVFYYDIRNDGTNPTNNEDNFGLMTFESGPKAGYGAYNTMARLLYHKRQVHDVPIGAEKLCYQCSGDGGTAFVAWSLTAGETLSFTSAATKLTLTDLMGNEQQLLPRQGVFTVALSEEPVYMTGATNITPVEPTIAFQADGLCCKGAPMLVTLHGDDTASWTPYLPDGWTVRKVGKTQFRITPPLAIATGEYPILFTAKGGSATTHVQITEPVTLAAIRTPGGVQASLRNATDLVQQVAVQAMAAGDRGPALAEKKVTLAPRAEQKVELAVPTETPDGYLTMPVNLALTVPGVSSMPTVRVLTSMTPAYQKHDVHIDGNIAEWQAEKPCLLTQPRQVFTLSGRWGGINDLSARFWVGYDAANCYLAVAATDDTHVQDNTVDKLWAGDSAQFAFGANGQRYEFDCGRTNDGKSLVYQNAPTTGVPAGVQVAVQSTGTMTTYEIAIPWSLLQINDPRKTPVTFALLLNDNDGQGRKDWIEWMEGIGATKDADCYAPLMFVPATR